MYRIKDIAMMTGLSDRTIRNHMERGYLKGELSDGTWLFTEEEVSSYMNGPYAAPAIKTRRNAIVFDWMAGKDNGDDEICIMLERRADKPQQWKYRNSSAGKHPAPSISASAMTTARGRPISS